MTLFSFNSERFQRRRGRENKKKTEIFDWTIFMEKKGKKNRQNLYSVPHLVKENK